MSTLPISPVRFIEDNEQGIHQYWKGFDQLHGVTDILKSVIFYDKYSGIDEAVLMNAARRGTAIHEIVQAELMHTEYDNSGEYAEEAEKALKAWQRFSEGTGLFEVYIPDCVEYLVSNEIDVASKVDVVFREGKEFALADIKTTVKLDEEYLSWQLSVYKYLFEKQTGEKVSRLIALWYDRTNGSWMAKEVKDKGAEGVEKLLNDWRNGVKWERTELPAPLIEIGEAYKGIELQIKKFEEQRAEFRTRLMEMMKEYGVKSVKLDGFSATYKEPTERKSFDVKAMLADHPELKEIVDNYYKTSAVAESILIKL